LIADGGADGYWRREVRDIIEGAPLHRCILMSIILGVNADRWPDLVGEGSTRAGQDQRTEGHAQTQPGVSNPKADGPVMNNIPGNFSYFPRGAVSGGRWLWLLDGCENLPSHHLMDRT